MKARFKNTNTSPQAAAVGTDDVGDVSAIYERDGVEYATIIFPAYGGEFNWIPTAELEIN